MARSAVICLVLALLPFGVSAVYVYKGNPFQPGPLPVATLTLNKDDGILKRTEIFYPTTPDTYAPVFFIPGVFGAVYTELYSTVLSHFASYGFIVAGVDVQWPLLDEALGSKEWAGRKREGVKAEPAELFQVLQWLMDNLNGKVFPSHGIEGMAADWNKTGAMSHSLGAQYITSMLQANSTFAKAVAFLDPASNNFEQPLNYSIPALAHGTQLSMEKPVCCEPGHSYFHYYSLLACPKVLMNVTGFGHCDINDKLGWELCHLTHICDTDESNNRDLYRQVFMPGVLTSLFGTYLQGNPDLVSYITHRDDMPLPLGQLWFDLNCTAPHTGYWHN